MKYCFECHEPLMPEDVKEHEVRCLECEGDFYIRMLNYRNGCQDGELEPMLAVQSGTIH